MGGKGRRRREKNYRAAHGGPARLPPPPVPSQVDALPSKLRQIMAFTTDCLHKAAEVDSEKKKNKVVNEIKLKPNAIKHESNDTSFKKSPDSDKEEDNKGGKKNKKRKRNQVTDLRFETTLDKLGGSSKRREHKKKYFEAKKKKRNNAKTKDNLEFPGREKIEFGDVVQAPPKLVSVPKGAKTFLDASKERLRLQAIETYRSRKGWSWRPGAAQLPPVNT